MHGGGTQRQGLMNDLDPTVLYAYSVFFVAMLYYTVCSFFFILVIPCQLYSLALGGGLVALVGRASPQLLAFS